MELNGITYSYDRKTDQLQGVTASIGQGKMTAIIGPNGSGKSTLLGVMARNLAPRSGTAVLDGKAIAAYKPKELARKLAVVHQRNDAPGDLTVERLAYYGRLPHRSLFAQRSEDDEEAVEWALGCTNLLARRGARICELSGGERQRVWIALALAQKTPILFLDEPTAYLDMYYQIELLELIRRLNLRHGLTIVIVLHDMNQAVRYCDEIIVMKGGQAVLQGTPEQVVTARTIKDIYGVDVVVRHDELAGMYIVPVGTGERN
ncbi:ABC transporter ATP-binding protein [Cohnella thermotolerans]|jgi:iron complex transport system ATP-binding protein|uniref:ABC transporter ATP-binding protein n=1 Tax=Cohnella thermotolerans TaxID=329858 RepID=UPI00041BE347|nr:ABC transporter ATP-binding protein [Cohnella thermotolerans]